MKICFSQPKKNQILLKLQDDKKMYYQRKKCNVHHQFRSTCSDSYLSMNDLRFKDEILIRCFGNSNQSKL